MKQRLGAQGFGIGEVVMIAAIVVVIGAIGYIAVRAFIKQSFSPVASAMDTRDAQATAQSFYAAYTNSHGQGAAVLAKYGTDNLIKASKTGTSTFSAIVCGRNVASVSTSTPEYVDGHFNVPVTMNFSPPLTFTAEVVKVSEAFKVDKVDCPESTDSGE